MDTERVQHGPIFLLVDGDFAGCCGLHLHKSEERIYELGFHLRRAHWGKGFAAESAQGVIAHAFDSLKGPEAICRPPSEECGFPPGFGKTGIPFHP
ncbi:MAG: GNAT family N-acetyltransferase [Candidatus Acidiferrum sp.]